MNLTALQTKVRFLLGELTSDNYSDANLNRSLNDYYHQAIELAVQEQGDWEVNGEYATTDIVTGQEEYVFDSDMLAIQRIEVNYTGNDNEWSIPAVVDMRAIKTPLSNDTDSVAGESTRIYIYDNSIFLKDLPTTDVTAGIKVYYTLEESDLSSGSDEPNLPKSLQPFLTFGACIDYSVRIGDEAGIAKFQELVDRMSLKIKEHYANRTPITRPQLKTRKENYK